MEQEEQEQVPSIPEQLESFSDVIRATAPTILETTSLIAHSIQVASNVKVEYTSIPTKIKASQLNKLQLELVLLDQFKRIRSSNKKAGSPIRMVPLPNGGYKMAIYFRELNKSTRQVSRVKLTTVDNCFMGLGGSRFFTRLEIFPCFARIPLTKESIEHTAFITSFGIYEWLTLPDGLYDGPATIQKYLEMVLESCKDSCVIYQHDILVHSRTHAGNIANVKSVLEALRKEKLFVNIRKSEFFQQRVEFLGHLVDKSGISVHSKIGGWFMDQEEPDGIDALNRFLGTINHYRKFIPDYAQLAGPLLEISKKHNQ